MCLVDVTKRPSCMEYQSEDISVTATSPRPGCSITHPSKIIWVCSSDISYLGTHGSSTFHRQCSPHCKGGMYALYLLSCVALFLVWDNQRRIPLWQRNGMLQSSCSIPITSMDTAAFVQLSTSCLKRRNTTRSKNEIASREFLPGWHTRRTYFVRATG